MSKVFLTGITGLVGSAFVVALSQAQKDIRFVCLARGSSVKTAAQRVEEIVRDECKFEGCPEIADDVLSHVDVISGDVVTIDPEALAADPLLAGTDKVFHCAADVNLGKDPTGKTFRINYNGTENVVRLAQLLKVREFHYVGTAYIAGKLVGTAIEDNPIDSGFNNPYEESKYKAEMLVRKSGIPFSVYRPAIITGRRSDGRVRKPLAFYRILEFLGKLKSHHCKRDGISPTEWYDMSVDFTAVPSDHIYFVPIDYVCEAIAALFQCPVCNKAYHITGDSPVTCAQIEDVVTRVLRLRNVHVGLDSRGNARESGLISKFIGDLFPYFSTDIVFDQSNVRKALGDGILDWDYGVAGLQTLITSYYKDFFSDVEWISELAGNVPEKYEE